MTTAALFLEADHMKAIIEVAPKGGIFDGLFKSARKVDAGQSKSSDYLLTFESSKLLLSELTAARIGLLEELRTAGPMSIYGLAKRVGRNYSNVHSDVTKLIEHGLVISLNYPRSTPRYNTHPAATLTTHVATKANNISARLAKPNATTTELANTATP